MKEYGPMPLDIDAIHAGQEKRRYITKLIYHCSASDWGDFAAIDEWHSKRWDGIVFGGKRIYCGYHYIILNGYRKPGCVYVPEEDGLIEKGRPDDFIGAHCEGQNRFSLGICLIGNTEFSLKQKRSLSNLTTNLTAERNLSIHGHCEFNPHKTCPNFDVTDFIEKWKSAYWDI